MFAMLSPAKNMRDVQTKQIITRPRFSDQAWELVQILRQFAPWELEGILRVNPELALRAFTDYQNFGTAPPSPALPAYRGLAYQYLDAQTLTQEDMAYAQKHLFLLSALYGVLRPLDGIRPHRLEMNSRLLINGKNLYRYWGDAWRNLIFRTGEPVVNLASAEYSSAVARWRKERDEMIDCVFLNPCRGALKQLPAPAKMARGRMARFIVQNKIDKPGDLKQFDWDGYRFLPHASGSTRYVFARVNFV